MNKKIIYIQPLQTSWKVPPLNAKWDNNTFYSFSRLLRADSYHINHNIPLDADIYVICSYDIALIDKEIEFFKRVKSLGKKTVLSFSQDFRFLTGRFLVNDLSGNHFGELCKYSDIILSGMSNKIKVYGRYQNRVIDFGLPQERLNFSIPFENRNIDILISNNAGEENWGITVEFLLMLRDNYPNFNITYSTHINDNRITNELKNSKINFVPFVLIHYLAKAKMYVNLEIRPRPGRSLLESFYCRTPFVSCDSTYYSKLFSEYTYSLNSIVDMFEATKKMVNSNYYELISDAEKIAEYDYFENFYKRLMKRLYE